MGFRENIEKDRLDMDGERYIKLLKAYALDGKFPADTKVPEALAIAEVVQVGIPMLKDTPNLQMLYTIVIEALVDTKGYTLAKAIVVVKQVTSALPSEVIKATIGVSPKVAVVSLIETILSEEHEVAEEDIEMVSKKMDCFDKKNTTKSERVKLEELGKTLDKTIEQLVDLL